MSAALEIFPSLPPDTDIPSAFIALGIAALLGFVISECYRLSNREIAHSQSFMHTIVLTVIIACIVTRVVDRIETAFLAAGALAVLRFRTVMKDAREFTFIFLAIVAGIGIGTRHFVIVICGTLFCALLIYALHKLQYGRHPHPPYKLSVKAPLFASSELRSIIDAHSVNVDFIGAQKLSEGEGTFRYELLLREAGDADRLLHSLQNAPSINDISLRPWRRTFGKRESSDD